MATAESQLAKAIAAMRQVDLVYTVDQQGRVAALTRLQYCSLPIAAVEAVQVCATLDVALARAARIQGRS
jgi:hypothetical protein